MRGVRYGGFVASLVVLGGMLVFVPATGQAVTRPLNDTGTTFCGDYPSGNNDTCDGSEPLGQDADYGRDAAAAAGVLTKVGGGAASFDFTKISNSGEALPATATLGSGADDWACTRDNVTGLTWEVKTDDGGLRDKDWTYTWYNSNASTNGGANGTASGGTCYQAGRCDTEKFAADVNSAGLCGHSDWRVPNVEELFSVANLNRFSPSIDTSYFPNTPSRDFWSSSPSAVGSDSAILVNFTWSSVIGIFRNFLCRVRLVRGGQ